MIKLSYKKKISFKRKIDQPYERRNNDGKSTLHIILGCYRRILLMCLILKRYVYRARRGNKSSRYVKQIVFSYHNNYYAKT